PQNAVDPTRKDEFHLNEFGMQYLIRLGSSYDTGLYTDMSSVRDTLKNEITADSTVLNLYSYTGAFSLWALKLGAKFVTSVDLSPKYIEWLQQNLGLNPEIDSSKHEAMVRACDEALNELTSSGKKYNF